MKNITRHMGSKPTADKVPALLIGSTGLLRSCREAKIPFYVGSDIGENPTLFSFHSVKNVRFSEYQSGRFVEELIAFGKSVGRKLAIFGDDDRATLSISRSRELLEPHFYFNFPEKERVEELLDKQRFASVAEGLGLPVPKSVRAECPDEVISKAVRLDFPLIMKPWYQDAWWHPDFVRIVGGHHKAIRCETDNDLVSVYKKVMQINPNVIIQELIPGDDSQHFSINMYLDRSGSLNGYFIGHKHRLYPIHAGRASYVETIKNDEILELSKEIASKLNIKGFCNIQYKRNSKTRELQIIEMHPRISYWGFLSTASGVNLLSIGYRDMLGIEVIENTDYRVGVKFIDLKRDIKALLQYRRTGEWTIPRWIRSFSGKKVFDIFSFRDPLPFIMDVWFEFKKKLPFFNSAPDKA